MKDLLNTEFKRIFSFSPYKSMKLNIAQMNFCKDFVSDKRGDLYPILSKSEDCAEAVEQNRYLLRDGEIKRLVCRFFPYATYELTASVKQGAAGLSFILPEVEATLLVGDGKVTFSRDGKGNEIALPSFVSSRFTLIVSCRPGAFDIYFMQNGKPEYAGSFGEEKFKKSNLYSSFSCAKVALVASGEVELESLLSYIDNGISIADMRPIRYENGEIMVEGGKVYLTVSIRMQAECFQGVISWVPGTMEIELCGALFYDSGDGIWYGDVAASVLYHRAEKRWYLWVCSFAHDHILGHSCFEGDVRFGVNVVDLTLMQKAPDGAPISEFLGFSGDEDPDFFYDEKTNKWLMAICRLDPATRKYRYVFFESDSAFEGYKFIGAGYDGAETGGSFVKVDGELYFVCGNDFNKRANYRIYHKGGMTEAKFDYDDGGFRGWGTLMPVKMGSRTRYFWMTFDRHNGSNYTWSYGNIYCFEG